MREAANDDEVQTDLERALAACPGPNSGDRWWARHRHLVMMEYGDLRHPDGSPVWPAAAEYAMHQRTCDRLLA